MDEEEPASPDHGKADDGSQSPDCSDFVGLVTREELDSSPRQDEEAEILALEATQSLIAPQEVYDRIVSDLAALRAAHPDLEEIRARPSWTPDAIIGEMTREGGLMSEIIAGTFTAWECPNRHYRVININPLVSLNLVILVFEPRLYVPHLVEEYMAVRGIVAVHLNHFRGEPKTDLCAEIDGDTHHYIFSDRRGGVARNIGFSVSEAGEFELIGDSVLSGFLLPEWMWARGACSEWLN